MTEVFKFKEFEVQQSQSAMKIGTDAVLLGAWINIPESTQSILDVGAGTGILGLQMAQRSFAETIDAVELDSAAYEECVDNFENSPWGDRLFCYHFDFKNFSKEMDEKYDLIISNPPFFKVSENISTEERNTARSQSELSFEELLKGVNQLLTLTGNFAVVIPYEREKEFIEMATQFNLFPNQILNVRGQFNSKIKRSLINFCREKSSIEIDELTIEISRHNYTTEYIELVEDFYLKM
ncbi:tRNA1(Val) (adenine(37)-N6)-methyltransferase [Psychroflexus aestuariivivens]|uniref:tRNA1(Val) (adenine(37)-N6)-methyltransferase n=1 Tax=Psychroflexus aestuariivivens TaxID=1795040 RepID=UPI000FD90513|nr:methyltransferase [Psychroflexus aestuariivivens]